MTRPQSAQDVFDSLSHHRLVEPSRLGAFIERHQLAGSGEALERLIIDGLLTPFQAEEVAYGRAAALWLGGYRLLDRLGKGAMGAVFLAEHSVLGRRVALKALSESLRADPSARRRFVREARAAATLDHPNIVRVFDVNMTSDPPYLVMEYVDGVSLQAAVARCGTFSTGEAAAVGVQVADGLVQAASVGLVHRDIKPANLLVDRRGSAKILDLGIVRFAHEDTQSRVNSSEVILGTIDYLAPEQAEDCSRVDSRADIYSLGATLYFLLAGHPPFPVADMRQKLAAKQTCDPPPIHELRPDVSEEFSTLLRRLMARDPAARLSTPALAVAALHAWASPGPDFPGRLFRATSDTTAQGRRLTDHEPAREQLPDTIVIVKGRRSSATPAAGESRASHSAISQRPPDEPSDGAGPPSDAPPTAVVEAAAQALDTQGVGCGGAPTDEIARPPEWGHPLDFILLAPPAPAPPEAIPEPEPASPAAPQPATVPFLALPPELPPAETTRPARDFTPTLATLAAALLVLAALLAVLLAR